MNCKIEKVSGVSDVDLALGSGVMTLMLQTNQNVWDNNNIVFFFLWTMLLSVFLSIALIYTIFICFNNFLLNLLYVVHINIPVAHVTMLKSTEIIYLLPINPLKIRLKIQSASAIVVTIKIIDITW